MRYRATMNSSYRGRKNESVCAMPDYVNVNGWDAGLRIKPGKFPGADSFEVYMTGGSHDAHGKRLAGTVRDTPSGPRWIPADKPGRVPATVGSPAMEVVAAIPVGAHRNEKEPREFIAVVHHRNWPSGEPVFGTVHAYLNDETGRWSADAGNYDQSQSGAVHDMIARAGCERPPAATEDEAAKIRELLGTIKSDAEQDVVYPDDIAELTALVEAVLVKATRKPGR